MLILQENVPSYLCPAVNSKSIALYYRCKLLPEGIEIEGLDFSTSGTRGIRVRLLSSNSISYFQLWAMILVACRLLLREDEVPSMICEDIVPDVASVKSNGYVDGIAFQLQGKCDK
jgi:hypothetical protein